jgi:DNA polymerase phi
MCSFYNANPSINCPATRQLLSRIDTVTCTQIFALVMDSSQTLGSLTGQEVRAILFCRLFGFMAIICSGLLVRNTYLHTSSPVLASSLSAYRDTLTELLALGDKKSWLRESAWWAVMLAIDALEASDVSWKADGIKASMDVIFVANKAWSLEKIALTSKLQNLYPKNDWHMLLSPSFKNSQLLSTANFKSIALILKVSRFDSFTQLR